MLDQGMHQTAALANLSQIRRGEMAVVRAIEGHPDLRSRLQEMGFTPGCPVQLVAKAAFGGPMAFHVRGSLVALRRSDAACVGI